MNERQRMQYMEWMGIDMFVPRYVLPSAQVSGVCSLPTAGEASSEPAQLISESNTPEGSASPILSEVLNPVVEKLEAAAPKPVAEESPQPDKSEPNAAPVRFSLALWQVGEIQIVDSRQQGDALPTDKLIGNILEAFRALQLGMPKAEFLNWPLVAGRDEGGWQAAKEMVQGFLDGRLHGASVKTFLLFGEDACHAVLGEAENFEALQFKTVAVPSFDVQAVVLPSLATILRNPSEKANVWRALLGVFTQ